MNSSPKNNKKETPKLISLGIESTAHTFGVGIIDSSGKVLADCR